LQRRRIRPRAGRPSPPKKPLTLPLLSANLPFLRSVLPPLFWLSHLTILRPGDARNVRAPTCAVGRLWHKLLYIHDSPAELSGTTISVSLKRNFLPLSRRRPTASWFI
jgi:hypothetical protein